MVVPRGGRQGVFVGISRAVCLFACSTSSAFGRNFEDVSGGVLVLALPGGGRQGAITGPFAPRLWGCPRRGAGFSTPKEGGQGVFHGPVRAQIVGMSQAVCLFRTSTSLEFGAKSEGVSGEALVSALPHSDTVDSLSHSDEITPLPQSDSHTPCEDVSGEALVSALPRGSRQGVFHGPRSRPVCGDVSGGLTVR